MINKPVGSEEIFQIILHPCLEEAGEDEVVEDFSEELDEGVAAGGHHLSCLHLSCRRGEYSGPGVSVLQGGGVHGGGGEKQVEALYLAAYWGGEQPEPEAARNSRRQ